MTTKGGTKINKVPAATLPKLRDAWNRANGAGQSAEAARQVAQTMFTQYQQHFATVLELIGLDSKKQWQVDLDTGEIKEATPEQQSQNGFAPTGQLGS